MYLCSRSASWSCSGSGSRGECIRMDPRLDDDDDDDEDPEVPNIEADRRRDVGRAVVVLSSKRR